jgi:hypothetical protein
MLVFKHIKKSKNTRFTAFVLLIAAPSCQVLASYSDYTYPDYNRYPDCTLECYYSSTDYIYPA